MTALGHWRETVPAARRMVVAYWDRFRADLNRLQPGMATGVIDATHSSHSQHWVW